MLQDVAPSTLGHLGDRGGLLPFLDVLHDADGLLDVREIHGGQLSVDDVSVDSHFERRSAANFC